MPIISIKNVSKKYGVKEVLKSVSFDIEKGEIFGLLGSNGAGKSTLTSIILGLERPSSGSVVLFGGERANIRKKITLVPQDTAFYNDFSIEKNLFFFASMYGLSEQKARERVAFLLKWLNLFEFRHTNAEYLSGGYQRLLNIALSLVHDPELIFLDEPTVGLDPKMRKMFWEKILELKSAGKTIVITTHYMDEAEQLCTKIVLLKKGALLAMGNPRELIHEYGGIKVMIFSILGGVRDDDVEKIRSVLRQRTIIAKGDLLFIPFEQEHSLEKVLAVTDWLLKKGYTITSSVTKEPTLEDVFLNITGEQMVKTE